MLVSMGSRAVCISRRMSRLRIFPSHAAVGGGPVTIVSTVADLTARATAGANQARADPSGPMALRLRQAPPPPSPHCRRSSHWAPRWPGTTQRERHVSGGCLCGAGGGYTACRSLQPRASNRHRQRGEESMVISQQLRGRSGRGDRSDLAGDRGRGPGPQRNVTVYRHVWRCGRRGGPGRGSGDDAWWCWTHVRPLRGRDCQAGACNERFWENVGAARAAGFAAAAPRSDARTWLATTDADSVVPTASLADQAVHHRALVQGV